MISSRSLGALDIKDLSANMAHAAISQQMVIRTVEEAVETFGRWAREDQRSGTSSALWSKHPEPSSEAWGKAKTDAIDNLEIVSKMAYQWIRDGRAARVHFVPPRMIASSLDLVIYVNIMSAMKATSDLENGAAVAHGIQDISEEAVTGAFKEAAGKLETFAFMSKAQEAASMGAIPTPATPSHHGADSNSQDPPTEVNNSGGRKKRSNRRPKKKPNVLSGTG